MFAYTILLVLLGSLYLACDGQVEPKVPKDYFPGDEVHRNIHSFDEREKILKEIRETINLAPENLTSIVEEYIVETKRIKEDIYYTRQGLKSEIGSLQKGAEDMREHTKDILEILKRQSLELKELRKEVNDLHQWVTALVVFSLISMTLNIMIHFHVKQIVK